MFNLQDRGTEGEWCPMYTGQTALAWNTRLLSGTVGNRRGKWDADWVIVFLQKIINKSETASQKQVIDFQHAYFADWITGYQPVSKGKNSGALQLLCFHFSAWAFNFRPHSSSVVVHRWPRNTRVSQGTWHGLHDIWSVICRFCSQTTQSARRLSLYGERQGLSICATFVVKPICFEPLKYMDVVEWQSKQLEGFAGHLPTSIT